MTTEKLSLKTIIESLEARWFMASMATGAMGIFTFLMFTMLKINLVKFAALFFIFLAFFIFFVTGFFTIIRLLKFPQAVKKDSKHPVAANFFAGISISSAVLSTSISNVLIPLHILNTEIGSFIALGFYLLSSILGLSFLMMVSVNLITSEETKTNHALGVWLLPPVGLFVAIFAGNFVAKYFMNSWGEAIVFVDLFIFGVALFYYFYTMTMIFHRIKFHPLPPAAMAPSFLIPLAPVGVSIIALFSFQAILPKIENLAELVAPIHSFFLIYTPLMIGFGLFWVISATLIIKHYLKHKGLPFSLGFWAFVFPVDAFGISLFLTSKIKVFASISPLVMLVWLISIFVWILAFSKTVSAIISGKAFQRPKAVK